jgi:hypothetical protein
MLLPPEGNKGSTKDLEDLSSPSHKTLDAAPRLTEHIQEG